MTLCARQVATDVHRNPLICASLKRDMVLAALFHDVFYLHGETVNDMEHGQSVGCEGARGGVVARRACAGRRGSL